MSEIETGNPSTPKGILSFVITIDIPGTRERFPTNDTQGGVIQAPSTNSGVIYVGDDSVSNIHFGAELQPGQSVGLAIDNTNDIYVDCSVGGDKVAFLGSN